MLDTVCRWPRRAVPIGQATDSGARRKDPDHDGAAHSEEACLVHRVGRRGRRASSPSSSSGSAATCQNNTAHSSETGRCFNTQWNVRPQSRRQSAPWSWRLSTITARSVPSCAGGRSVNCFCNRPIAIRRRASSCRSPICALAIPTPSSSSFHRTTLSIRSTHFLRQSGRPWSLSKRCRSACCC